MDINKRYCWPTLPKRKRKQPCQKTNEGPLTLNNYVSSSDEERAFKLKKFFESAREHENGSFSQDSVTEKDDSILIHKTIKPTIKKKSPPKTLVRRGLFQNNLVGVQTKFKSKGRTKEVKSKLDEKLREIINLSNKNQSINQIAKSCKQNDCKMSLDTRLSLRSDDWHWSPSVTPATEMDSIGQKRMSLSQLDKELYPIFTRVVSDSCARAKSVHFEDKSYISEMKRKLLKIYLKGQKEHSEEFTCVSSDTHKTKISVATSPLPSPEIASVSSQSDNLGPGPVFTDIKFVYTKPKSTLEFLEETIGPRSSSSQTTLPSISRSPDLRQRYCSHDVPGDSQLSLPRTSHKNHPVCTSAYLSPISRDRKDSFPHAPTFMCQNYQPPHTSSYLEPNYHQPLLSSPTRHPATFTHLSKYINESPCPYPDTPPYNWKSRIFDSGGGNAQHSLFKNFLPPIEEESPEFQYFPRRMF